jgi:hypothetical protein
MLRPPKTEEPITIVYDVDLMRPACVLIQRLYGANISTEDLAMLFPAGSWLVAPTPGMRGYRVTREELEQMGRVTKERSE